MKRRTFGLLATTSLAALKFGMPAAKAAPDPSLLKTTLTPVGAERAGNAEGTIPAWTGGNTSIPAGWDKSQAFPDIYADEPSTLTINSSNMAQYADKLTEGVMALMTKVGFSIKVYPTHRTAAATQWVYDNTALNATRTTLSAAGGRFGYDNAFGGFPFPIPDPNNAENAGAQVVWNHFARWPGAGATTNVIQAYPVNSGQVSLAAIQITNINYPYYQMDKTIDTYGGIQFQIEVSYRGPANFVGEQIIQDQYSNPWKNKQQVWELLAGQSRIRMAPELQYDTPASQDDGNAFYDETFNYAGSLDRYNWNLIGKKEMYIPYNNNGLMLLPPLPCHLEHFIDPNVVRWELHRVWEVEATLAPGERHVLHRRRFYVDEDSWICSMQDSWDANKNLYHAIIGHNFQRPDLPAVIYLNDIVHNMQTGDYISAQGFWNQKAVPNVKFFDSLPQSLFDPQNMAATAQY